MMSWNRTTLLATGILLFVVLITACHATDPDRLPGKSTVTPIPPPSPAAHPIPRHLTIWHEGEGLFVDTVLEAVKPFEAAHPGLTIEMVRPGELEEDLGDLLAAGDGPDILRATTDRIEDYAQDRSIIDLNSLGIDRAVLENTYEPVAADGVIWRDRIWALPETLSGIALVYNKTLLTREYRPIDPLGFDRLLESARKFAAAYPGKSILCSPALGGIDGYSAAPIYFGFGVPTFIDEQRGVLIDSPSAVRAGEFIAAISAVLPDESSEGICERRFLEGETAVWWTGPWVIEIVADSGIDFGILPMGRPYVDIQAYMITRNAVERGNADIAVELIQFLTDATRSKMLTLAVNSIPANTAALNDAEIQALDVVSGFGAAYHSGIPMPPASYADDLWATVGEATYAIWSGGQTPTEALGEAREILETELETIQSGTDPAPEQP